MKKRLVILAAVLTALSARAEQKNVQLLTNMSDLELGRTMNMMRASLGVHCDYCHVLDEKAGWQWDKDDKKEKKTAREMIALTLKINKEGFNNHVEVSCWTCHRGSVRPVSLVTLPQAAPPFPTPKPERPTLPTRDEVVKKYAYALGNFAMISKPRQLKGMRFGTDNKPVPIDVEESGNRWRVVADLPGGHIEQVVTDEGGWSKDNKGVTAVPAGQLESYRQIAAAMTPILPPAIPADARVVGKESIGNLEAFVMVFRTPDQVRHRLYFNSTTGFLIRAVTVTETPIGLIPQQTDYDDWRNVQGTVFPYIVRSALVDPWLSSTRTYTSVVLDARIDDAAFAAPK